MNKSVELTVPIECPGHYLLLDRFLSAHMYTATEAMGSLKMEDKQNCVKRRAFPCSFPLIDNRSDLPCE